MAGHVHLHVLVTAGGLDSDGNWRLPVKSCLLPRKVLMIKFRGKLRAKLIEKLDRDELVVPPDTTEAKLRGLLNKLGRTVWNVKILERYDHGKGVATYLAHYLKGGPIGNSRLLSERAGRVYFRYRVSTADRTDCNRQSVMNLSVDEFIARLLEHVPPRRFQAVRGYGLYCGNQHARLGEAHEALGSNLPESDAGLLSVEEFLESSGQVDVGKCPTCGARLVSHSHFERGRGPPLSVARLLQQRERVA